MLGAERVTAGGATCSAWRAGRWPAVTASNARRQPLGHRVRRHPRVAPHDEIPIQRRDRSQTPLDRRRQQPRRRIGGPHDVRGTGPAPTLIGDEGHRVALGHLLRLLGDNGEEHLQVVRVRLHRVRPGAPGHELQELNDRVMADASAPLAVTAGPYARTPCSTSGLPLHRRTEARERFPSHQPRRGITRICRRSGHRAARVRLAVLGPPRFAGPCPSIPGNTGMVLETRVGSSGPPAAGLRCDIHPSRCCPEQVLRDRSRTA